MTLYRFVFAVSAALTIAACDSPLEDVASDVPGANVLMVSGPTIDLRFQPESLGEGEIIALTTRDLRLESTAIGGEHYVHLDAPNRVIRRIVGLLDGKEQAVVQPSHSDHTPAGTTDKGPTSIHKIKVCDAHTCSEAVEYDYDLHSPSGNGEISWTTKGGQSVTIDRLRFELDIISRVSETASVLSSRPLIVVQ